MHAARYPDKVASLVLGGAPIETHADTGRLLQTVILGTDRSAGTRKGLTVPCPAAYGD